MSAAERLSFERELRDLGIATRLAAAEVIGADERRELQILPPDQRRHWSGTLAVPYRWICSIEVYRADPRGAMLLHGKGTGVLIGADCVLTAAHNLWRQENGEPRRVDRVVVIPARDGTTKPFGSVQAADWRTAASWDARRRQWRWDFALIRLKEAIGNKSYPALRGGQLGWWGSTSLGGGTSMRPLKADWLKDRKVISAGYPGDKCGTRSLPNERAIQRCARDQPEIWASTQWWGEGIVRALVPARGLLHHTIDTHEGQSGSPVWYYWRDPKLAQEGHSLVGLHVAPGTIDIDPRNVQRRVDNMAVWISQDVLDEIARLRTALRPAAGAGTREAEAGEQAGLRRRRRFALPTRSIQFQFTLYKKQRIAGSQLGSYRFQMFDDKSNVVAEADWTRIPPDIPTSSAPDYYNSYSEIVFFHSSASRLMIKVRVFPVHYTSAGKAEMESASLGKDVSVNLPRDKQDIKIAVILAAKTQRFHVPAGRTLREVLVQNKINPLHVAKAYKPQPHANYHDVTYVVLDGVVHAQEKTSIGRHRFK